MAEPYLPPKLWRVVVKGPDGYLRPRSKTYAMPSAANDHAEQAERRGYTTEIYECEPVWRKVDG
jgi:hypothetical protein